MAFEGKDSAWCPWCLTVNLALLPLVEVHQETQPAFARLFVRKRLVQGLRCQKPWWAASCVPYALVRVLHVLETSPSMWAQPSSIGSNPPSSRGRPGSSTGNTSVPSTSATNRVYIGFGTADMVPSAIAGCELTSRRMGSPPASITQSNARRAYR